MADPSALIAAISMAKMETATAMVCLTALTIVMVLEGRATDAMILATIVAVSGLGGYQIGKFVPGSGGEK